MRPKLENPPAKNKILEKAQGLVISKGYSATTVDEICQKAGVTKGSFFHYFKSKEDLGKQLISRFSCGTQKMLSEGCCGGGKDPLDRIYGCIDFMIRASGHPDFKGCLVGSMSQ